MTFITRTFKEFSGEELGLLSTNPPTDESRALAERIGRRMGEYAYPGDMVRQSIGYEAGQHSWPPEIAAILANLAFEGMQHG